MRRYLRENSLPRQPKLDRLSRDLAMSLLAQRVPFVAELGVDADPSMLNLCIGREETPAYCRAHWFSVGGQEGYGAMLGNRCNASEAAALGRASQAEGAKLFAANTLLIIKAIRNWRD
jgi:hypothetical protein